MKPVHMVTLGFTALALVATVAVVLLDSKTIKEKTFADRKNLEFTEYCIKGKVVLKISGAVSADVGYLYDLNDTGSPKLCS